MVFHEFSQQRKVSMAIKREHLLISGQVQGVSFRAYTEQKARALGLTGFVRNLSDGRVEVIAEGDESQLEILKRWCHEGSPQAVVDEVVTETQSPTGEFDEFRTAT